MFAIAAHAAEREAHLREVERSGRSLPEGSYGQRNRQAIAARETRVSARLRAVEQAYRKAIERDAVSAPPEHSRALHSTGHAADREIELDYSAESTRSAAGSAYMRRLLTVFMHEPSGRRVSYRIDLSLQAKALARGIINPDRTYRPVATAGWPAMIRDVVAYDMADDRQPGCRDVVAALRLPDSAERVRVRSAHPGRGGDGAIKAPRPWSTRCACTRR
jgi:hypothetical protein